MYLGKGKPALVGVVNKERVRLWGASKCAQRSNGGEKEGNFPLQ